MSHLAHVSLDLIEWTSKILNNNNAGRHDTVITTKRHRKLKVHVKHFLSYIQINRLLVLYKSTHLYASIKLSSSTSYWMVTSFLPLITARKLNDRDYFQWSQSVLMFIRGMKKDDYITGTFVASEKTSSITKNYMVMLWLISTINTDIDPKKSVTTDWRHPLQFSSG